MPDMTKDWPFPVKMPAEASDVPNAAGQRRSRTGAALGRPDAEEGQYGMTKPATSGEKLTEKEIRGVGGTK